MNEWTNRMDGWSATSLPNTFGMLWGHDMIWYQVIQHWRECSLHAPPLPGPALPHPVFFCPFPNPQHCFVSSGMSGFQGLPFLSVGLVGRTMSASVLDQRWWIQRIAIAIFPSLAPLRTLNFSVRNEQIEIFSVCGGNF
jgi:hypothetical protein